MDGWMDWLIDTLLCRYGTSSIDIWLELMQNSIITEAICSNRAISDNPPIITIFGSSSGLLLCYSSFCCPFAHVQGYEVLPILHKVASQLKEQFFIGKYSIYFFYLDLFGRYLWFILIGIGTGTGTDWDWDGLPLELGLMLLL